MLLLSLFICWYVRNVNRWYRWLLRLSGGASRTGVFLFDLLFAIISFITACLLVFEFNLAKHSDSIWTGLILLLSLRIIAAFSLQTHSLIIRYIGEKDLVKVFVAILGASLSFLLVVMVWEGVFPERRFKALVLVDFLLLIFMSGSFRVFLRLASDLFSRSNSKHTVKQNTIILGAGELGAMTERVLRKNKNHPYRIVGFIDDNPDLEGSYLDGIRIYGGNQDLARIFQHLNVEVGIIGINNLDEDRRLDFITQCLASNVKVLKVPPTEDWINGDLAQRLSDINFDDLLSRPPIKLDKDRIRDSYNDRVILVTGCAGSIGSEITRQLLVHQPKLVIGLDNAESPLAEFSASLSDEPRFKGVIGSILDENLVEQLFVNFRPMVVFHAAAYKHVPVMEDYPAEAIKTNVHGTRILADMSCRFGVEKFVMISTDKVVKPSNVMGASKRLAEIYAQSMSLRPKNMTQFITTRFGNVLGSNGSVVPIFKKRIEQRKPIQVTHPDVTRFFMTIQEACQLVLEAGAIGEGGEILVFDMGRPVRIYDLARKMIHMAGLIPDQDIPIEFCGLRPGEKLHEELLDNGEKKIPTHHPKILKASVRPQDYREVLEAIDLLVNIALAGAPEEILVLKMQELVPDYKPNNTRYPAVVDPTQQNAK